MRRRRMWLGVLAALVVAGNAAAITVDGQWNDWFSYSGTSDSNWNQSSASGSLLNPAIRYGNDSDSDADGGQNYDAEQIFYLYVDTDANSYSGGTLYVGLVTGYEPSNSSYRSGDLFIDLGCEGAFDLAVGTATENSESRLGDTWSNDGWQTSGVTISSNSDSSPYRVKEYRSGATYYGQSAIDWDTGVGPGSAHNFLEIAVTLNGAHEEKIALGGLGLHWTMACGNDAINVCDCDPLVPPPPPPPPPNDPVPEPATMVLLGMGTLGIALRTRRPSL